MSFELPTSRPSIPLAKYTRGRTIYAEDWARLAKGNHYHFSRTRSKVAGLVYDGSPFSTTSTTNTTVDANGGRNLDTWTPIIELPRRHEDSGFKVEVICRVYGRNIRVTWALIGLDNNTGFGTKTDAVNNTANWQYAQGFQTLSWANAHVGGSTANPLRQFLISPLVRRQSAISVGELWAITFYSVVLTASQIPSTE